MKPPRKGGVFSRSGPKLELGHSKLPRKKQEAALNRGVGLKEKQPIPGPFGQQSQCAGAGPDLSPLLEKRLKLSSTSILSQPTK